MFYRAENAVWRKGGAAMDYVAFGQGARPLVMIPGLGDGCRTVRGLAVPMALSYGVFARQYRVYLFSRIEPLPKGYTTRQMAADLAAAMTDLGIAQADVLGVSQGGMIAQYLALDAPQLVRRLVLAVTLGRQSPTVRAVVGHWIDLARQRDARALMADISEHSYTEKKLRFYRLLYPLLGLVAKPQSYDRLIIQAESCLGHDALGSLGRIACPTLVIGAGQDRVVGVQASRELAEAIPQSQLEIYPGYGHGVYEEAPDFNRRVLRFLQG